MKKFFNFDLKHKKAAARDQHAESRLFAKYFPKYQNEVTLTSKNGAVESKIKRAKIIHSFRTSKDLKNSSNWQTLFTTKLKSITTLNSNLNSAKQFSEKVRSFPNLKSIQIFMPDLLSGSAQLAEQREKDLNQAFENMRSLKKLKHLLVTPISKDTYRYLSKLNSSPRLLSSLITFKIGFDWRQTSDCEVSEQIESNKNILKNASSLSLGPLYLPIHFESFQRLPEFCPQISSLSFEMSYRPVLKRFFPSRYSDHRLEVNINYLQNLKAFENLKNLRIDVADTFTFLKDLSLPSSLQYLRFEFIENLTKEIMLKIDDNFAESKEEELPKFFEENDLLLRFYENFKGLEHLQTLDINYSSDSDAEAYRYQSSLSQSWLKRVPSSLKNLRLLSTANSWGFNSKFVYEISDSNLSKILESCQHFAETLETLELGSQKVVYSKYDLSAIQSKFTSLSSLKISGRFIQVQDSDIDTMGLFLKQVISIGGDSLNHIEFEASINPRTESLLSLLRQMKQLVKPKTLKIELKISFFISSQTIVDLSYERECAGSKELKNNQEYDSKVEGVSVKFSNLPHNAVYKEFIALYSGKFENL